MRITRIFVLLIIAIFLTGSALGQRKRTLVKKKVTPPAPAVVAAAPGGTLKPPVDMDDNGRSDFVVIRETGGATSSEGATTKIHGGVFSYRERRKIMRERYLKRQENGFQAAAPSVDTAVWWTKSSTTGLTSGALYGNFADDVFVSADFDGDGADDLIYWRPDSDPALSGFHWINSSNSTVGFDAFGTFLDDPTVVGDYDGDGIDDRAVFRCPDIGEAPGPCYYFYRSSANPSPSFNYSPWGYGTIEDFFPCAADYDGDNKMDLCVQRIDPNNSNSAQYVIQRSLGGQAEYISWGGLFDFIIPGDYDGDGRADFCARRNVLGVFHHYILFRTGATDTIIWGGTNGLAPDDVSVPGDYDGDTRTDIAIWRPADGVFWVRHANGSTRGESWGITSDYPLANFSVR